MGDQKEYRSSSTSSDTQGVSDDDRSFDDIVAEWTSQFGLDSDTQDSQPIAPASESAVDAALASLTEQNWVERTDLKLRSMVSNFPYATFVVLATGRILRMNEAALAQFDVLPDDHIDGTELTTSDGRSVSDAVLNVKEPQSSASDIRLIEAVRSDSCTAVTLAMLSTRLEGFNSSCHLIFVVDTTVRQDMVARFGRFFELTSAEQSLLHRFLGGKDLRTISEDTGKSIKTLRTQFHATMRKVGVNRQADLVSKILTMSHFLDQLDPIAKIASHPNRKRVDLLRPGPRTLEVFLAGDLRGELIVVVPNVTMRTFPAELEDEFHRLGLCVATICRPGYGGTDPAPPGQSTRQCFADDFQALLDQLNAPRARLLAQNTASGYAIGLARDRPDLVSDVLLVSAMPPLPYLSVGNSNSKLSAAFIKARKISPKLFRLLMHLSIRAWKIGGVQRVHGRQMSPYLPDLDFLKRADIVEEFDECMRSRFAQDLDGIAEDFEIAISDWTDDMRACQSPISILHGQHDQAVAICDVRRWRDDFPDLVSLTEVENAGFMLPHSHRAVFLSAVAGGLPRT